ncbi:MAG: methyl-accepting chemotaxis protein, partial [Verrucomicrobia bacterium]|nr:methyl-accepting chemotaxis protein [Verrucomicrobiota bacterium]
MLKRILLAVSILTLGFILVVALVNKQLGGIGGKVKYLAGTVTPLSKSAADSGDHTSRLMMAVSEASLPVEDNRRAELKKRAFDAARALKNDLDQLQSPKFKALHSMQLEVPVSGEGETSKKATFLEVLGSLGESAVQISELAGTTIDLAQKKTEVQRQLLAAQEDLSRVFRSCLELAPLDAKGFNSIARSVMIAMYSRSIGDASTARAKFTDGLKAIQKANPSAEQETQLSQLKASFDKTLLLLTESLAASDDYALFAKSVGIIMNNADAITDFSAKIFQREQAELANTVVHAISTSLLLSVATIIAGVGITVVIARRITRPLERATELVVRVARNDLTETVTVTTSDEVGQIGDALNTMVANLRGNINTLHNDSISLSAASTELSQISQQVSANASQTCSQAEVVTDASQRVSQDVQSVSAALEE